MLDQQDQVTHRPTKTHKTPVAVQIISTLAFAGFAITATTLAFVHFWPAGLVLAVILGWRGGFVPAQSAPVDMDAIVTHIRNLGPEAQNRSTGNASFDAYREDVLDRLELERGRFEGFLGRLREAKDKSEFDRFMDERAKSAAIES